MTIMKRYAPYLFIAAGLGLCSCSQKEMTSVPDSEAISTSAAICSIEKAETRSAVSAAEYELTVPTMAKPLNADIWFSTVENEFSGNTYPETDGVSGNNIDAHRTITYTSNNYTFPAAVEGNLLQYPTGTVYCVGFSRDPRYPENSMWTATDGGSSATLTTPIDGVADIMYAPQIQGSSSVRFPVQKFYHALTWIKIRIRTQTSDASVTWGKIKKITVLSCDKAVYDIENNAMTFECSDGQNYAQIVAFDKDPGDELPNVSKEVGSVFVAPISGTDEEHAATLHLIVDTDEWTGKPVTVKLMKNALDPNIQNDNLYNISSTAGKQYVVTLSFNALSTIDASATLVPWVDETGEITGSAVENPVNLTVGQTCDPIQVIVPTATVNSDAVSANASIADCGWDSETKMLTIEGKGEGETIVTVSAYDSASQAIYKKEIKVTVTAAAN